MIAIIDYGVGNLHSLSSSLNYLGLENKITSIKDEIKAADRIILPGVGAFADAYSKLESSGLVSTLTDETQNGKPLLGICLGMQLLFDRSYEYGIHHGLSLISGEIGSIEEDLPSPMKVPHMGWNRLDFKRGSPLLKYIPNGCYVYYVHSYYAKNCDNSIDATSFYGLEIPGVVSCRNVYGTQFHPEKSGNDGLKILRAFSEV